MTSDWVFSSTLNCQIAVLPGRRNALHWSQMYNDPEPRLFQLNYGPEYFLQVRLSCRLLFELFPFSL